MSEVLTESAIRSFCRDDGREITVLPQTDSTNTAARLLAESGAPAGTAVAADRQTAGRGRRGHSFFSPAGGVYLSLILRPDSPAQTAGITACAAVAAARAIERLCAVRVTVKWVNDLLIDGRKVGGILTEAALEQGASVPQYVILGIGINVGAVDFPPELAGLATSLAAQGAAVDRAALIAALLEQWDALSPLLGNGGYLEEYRRRSAVLGRSVTVCRGNECFPATAESITDAGHLLVRLPDGTPLTLSSGEISVRL